MTLNEKLSAINRVLRVDGARKVSSLSQLHPDAEEAQEFLDDNLKDFLIQGLYFNTDIGITLQLNSGKNIEIPTKALSVDLQNHARGVVQRGRVLYDRINNTDKFTSPQKCDIVWLIPYEDCPPHVQAYIKYKTIFDYAVAKDVDGKILQVLEADKKKAYADYNKISIKQADHNVFNRPNSYGHLRGRSTLSNIRDR